MSSEGYDSHSVAAIGGAGGSAATQPTQGAVIPGGILAQLIGINPNGGSPGILPDTPGIMAKTTNMLGTLPKGPFSFLNASLAKHFVPMASMGDSTAGIMQTNLEPAHIDGGAIGGLSPGGAGGSVAFAEMVGGSRGGDVEIG